MANTTSGTTTFDKTFVIDEIIEDSLNVLDYRTLQVINLNLQDDLLISYFKNGVIEVFTIGK